MQLGSVTLNEPPNINSFTFADSKVRPTAKSGETLNMGYQSTMFGIREAVVLFDNGSVLMSLATILDPIL